MKEIYLGIDLCRKNLQMSYFREDRNEPESIYQLNNTETYQLPNVMFYCTDENKWYVGNNVSGVRFNKNGKIIEDVMGNIGLNNNLVINGNTYTYDELLMILLKEQIEEFMKRFEDAVLKKVSITVEKYEPHVFDVLRKLSKELSLGQDDFYIMSHENAFFQYVMRQEEELKNNSISMFTYSNEGMNYYRIDKKNQGKTAIYNLNVEKIPEISYSMLFEDVEKLDLDFAEIAKLKMRDKYISTVYLTGSGFHDKWIEKSKNVLCSGRRVFMGQNLYTKGACYHARLGAYEHDKDVVFRSNEFITYDIGVLLGDPEGRNSFYPIVSGGREWYNMKGSVELFLDDTNRLQIMYRDRITKDTEKDIIEIHGLPKRPPKTTKLSLEVELYDEKNGAIIIRDVGFGSIYPTTNKIYRREISWQE